MTQQRELFVNIDDGLSTLTSTEQEYCESTILPHLSEYWTSRSEKSVELLREHHQQYLRNHLENLSSGFKSLDASQAWIGYWILHSLELLSDFPAELTPRLIEFFRILQNETGGFGGGARQLSHLAPTYASVNALVTIGTEEAYNLIDRQAMYRFLLSLKQPDGSFLMHYDGECDVRGVYCAISVASMLDILTPELTANTADFIKRCQTYEGGIGAFPYSEAHGGYTFCGVAAMSLLGKLDDLDVENLLYWLSRRQMILEGGFQGRTNKLVDGCYSFWQAAPFAILDDLLVSKGFQIDNQQVSQTPDSSTSAGSWFFDQGALQEYVLLCCQEDDGGLKDKPEKYRDFYHTCYCLSGVSIAQHNAPRDEAVNTRLGPGINTLLAIDPVHNVSLEKVARAKSYFKSQPRFW